MYNLFSILFFIAILIIAILIFTIIALCVHGYRTIWQKNRNLFLQIKEQDRLEKFLEQALEEKNIFYKYLKNNDSKTNTPPNNST